MTDEKFVIRWGLEPCSLQKEIESDDRPYYQEDEDLPWVNRKPITEILGIDSVKGVFEILKQQILYLQSVYEGESRYHIFVFLKSLNNVM